MRKFFIFLAIVVFTTVSISIPAYADIRRAGIVENLPEFAHDQKIMEKVFKLRVENFFQKTVPRVFERNAISTLRERGKMFFLQTGLDVLGKTQVKILPGKDNFKLSFKGHIDNPRAVRLAGEQAVKDFYDGDILRILKAYLSTKDALLAKELLTL